MAAPKKLYADIDWGIVWKKLYLRAVAVTRIADAAFDFGVSAEDLVNETLTVFFESPEGLGWRPKKASLPAFLSGVLHHKFIDHMRRERRVAGSMDDEAFRETRVEPHLQATKGMTDPSDLGDLLRERVKGEKSLEDLITAAELVDGDHNVNQQLGDLLGISTAEVVNRKKRLLRIPGVRVLHERNG